MVIKIHAILIKTLWHDDVYITLLKPQKRQTLCASSFIYSIIYIFCIVKYKNAFYFENINKSLKFLKKFIFNIYMIQFRIYFAYNCQNIFSIHSDIQNQQSEANLVIKSDKFIVMSMHTCFSQKFSLIPFRTVCYVTVNEYLKASR